MSALKLATRQLYRQASLQPRLALPAGRTISLEEGRQLAKLVAEEDERIHRVTTELLNATADSPVIVEEKVSKKIALLRQQQQKDENVRAAVQYAKRQAAKHASTLTKKDADHVTGIAQQLLHRKAPGNATVMKHRLERAVPKQSKSKKK